MKKVKRMALGGVSKAAKNAAAKALVPPPKIQTMANLSGASTVTAPPKIQTMANLPRGSTVAPPTVQNAISNINAGNIPKPQPGGMVGQRFGGMGMKKGGSVSSASKRADGCAVKGKTKGKIV